jgi:hypothetical protein
MIKVSHQLQVILIVIVIVTREGRNERRRRKNGQVTIEPKMRMMTQRNIDSATGIIRMIHRQMMR